MPKGKLQKTAENLEYIRRILFSGVWLFIFLILFAGVGWFLVKMPLQQERMDVADISAPVVKQVAPQVEWQKVDTAVAEAMKKAREDARRYADAELDIWISGIMQRVDESFLDWYFSYWTQQQLGLKGLYQYGVHYFIKNQPTAAEKLTEEIQTEFSQRVLRPQIAQKVLERIITATATRYIAVLQDELETIPESYNIGRGEWQKYLEDIALTSGASAGRRQTPLTLKALTLSGTGGAVMLALKMKTMGAKVGTKIMTTSSGKVASAMAAKTGGKVAAKVGGKFFGTIAGIGVLVWDIWDHNITKQENRPLLRQSLQDYFAELQTALLDDPEFGIMTTLYSIERQVADA